MPSKCHKEGNSSCETQSQLRNPILDKKFLIKTKRQFITRLHPVEKILLKYNEQSECVFFSFILDTQTNCEVVYKVENWAWRGWLSNVCLCLWIRNNQKFVFFKVCVKTFSGYLLLESRYASAKFLTILTKHEAGNTTEMRESGEAEIQTHKQCSQDWDQGEVSSNSDQEWCISLLPSQEREDIYLYIALND